MIRRKGYPYSFFFVRKYRDKENGFEPDRQFTPTRQ